MSSDTLNFHEGGRTIEAQRLSSKDILQRIHGTTFLLPSASFLTLCCLFHHLRLGHQSPQSLYIKSRPKKVLTFISLLYKQVQPVYKNIVGL